MGTPVMWYDKFLFRVEIDGVTRAAFRKCSELRIEGGKVSYREGGRIHPHKSPGLVDFPDITLERGKSEDMDLYNWFKTVYDAASGKGQVPPDVKRVFDIVQVDRAGNEKERYTVHGAFPIGYSAGDWDNDAEEHGMETVTLAVDYWERTPA